jgi:hypothetical protein
VPDEGAPISYEVLEHDTPVYCSDGVTIGKVHAVRADFDADIFDGLDIDTAHGPRFIYAEHVVSIHERGVDLDLDSAAVVALPIPGTTPPSYAADPAEPVHKLLGHIAERLGKGGWKRSS